MPEKDTPENLRLEVRYDGERVTVKQGAYGCANPRAERRFPAGSKTPCLFSRQSSFLRLSIFSDCIDAGS